MFRQFPPYFLGLVAIFILIAARSGPAQTRCLTAAEIKQLTGQINANTPRPFNKELSDELNKLAARQQQRVENNVADNKSGDKILKTPAHITRAEHRRALLNGEAIWLAHA